MVEAEATANQLLSVPEADVSGSEQTLKKLKKHGHKNEAISYLMI
jgi:hypothetical protein